MTPDHHGQRRAARVGGDVLGLLRDPVELAEQAPIAAAITRATANPRPRPTSDPTRPQHGALGKEEPPNLAARRAERTEDADLRPPLRHRDRERVVDDEHPDEEREGARDVHHQRVPARIDSAWLAARWPAAEPRSPGRAAPRSSRWQFTMRRSPLHREIDAVERASAPEHLLRRVHVHHGQVAAERAGQSRRLHDAAHRELPLPLRGSQRQLTADARAGFVRPTRSIRSANPAGPGTPADRRRSPRRRSRDRSRAGCDRRSCRCRAPAVCPAPGGPIRRPPR